MNKRYFKLVPANAADAAQLKVILTNKTFYPEATSDPVLPLIYDDTFDYRQFFIIETFNADGSVIVYTRQEWTTGEFATDCIPTADWTTRYRLSVAPTVTAMATYFEDTILANNRNSRTSVKSFLSYDYNLFTNI